MNLSFLKTINWDLGIRSLIPEWKKLLNPKNMQADLFAGITVAFVAIPLSLAIALASGLPPGIGLVAAILAGVVCALFGGSPLSVSGPAAAMAVLVAANVEKYGATGLIFLCLLCGLMQLFSGVLGLGRLARYVPLPVIAGFTAGIGVIIMIGQLPRAFGITPPEQSHIYYVFTHLDDYIFHANMASLFLVVLTFLIIRGLPKVFTRIPSILIAVIVSTVVAQLFFPGKVVLISQIPNTLPPPVFPSIPNFPWKDLIADAVVIYMLASLETLLSCTAIDKLTNDKKHDSNQELIGQGLGNMVVSLFGGMPVTAVIARSLANIHSGAKTRRASIIHSGIVLLSVLFFSSIISKIPIAALAGVLFSVALSMVNLKEFRVFWMNSRSEAFIYGLTFLTIVAFDLIAGVQVGIIAAGLILLFKAARSNLHVSSNSTDRTLRLSLTGALTFLASTEIHDLENKIQKMPAGSMVILDLSNITDLDTTAAALIVDLCNQAKKTAIDFYIKGLPHRFEPIFQVCNGELMLQENYLISESQLREVDGDGGFKSLHGRLIHGVKQFYRVMQNQDRRLFKYLALQQDPHTLFITCSDSRMIPSHMTFTDPGELFIIRNVGNYIPRENEKLFSEAAAIEFAMTQLNITDIIICGHSNCGAINACVHPSGFYPEKLTDWVTKIKNQLGKNFNDVNEAAKSNVLNQVENLKTYQYIREKIEHGTLSIYAWFFDFEGHKVHEWNPEHNAFCPIHELYENEEVI